MSQWKVPSFLLATSRNFRVMGTVYKTGSKGENPSHLPSVYHLNIDQSLRIKSFKFSLY